VQWVPVAVPLATSTRIGKPSRQGLKTSRDARQATGLHHKCASAPGEATQRFDRHQANHQDDGSFSPQAAFRRFGAAGCRRNLMASVSLTLPLEAVQVEQQERYWKPSSRRDASASAAEFESWAGSVLMNRSWHHRWNEPRLSGGCRVI